MARKTKQDALQTRELILDAAQNLFREQGVSRTSLQQIAQAADVTRGAIYWHFSDKLALFQALLDRAALPCDEILLDVKLQNDISPLEKIVLIISELARLISDNEQIRCVFDIVSHKIELVGEFAVMHECYTSHLNRVITAFEQLFLLANESGEIHLTPQQIHSAARGVNALADGLFHAWLHAPSEFNLHDIMVGNVQVYLQGLKHLPHNFPDPLA